MSKTSAAKKARRRKRQAARDQTWIPVRVREDLAEQFDIASELEDFEERLTARGWEIAEDADDADDADDAAGVAWYWPASVAEVPDETEQTTATVVLLTPEDGGEIAHVVFVGTSEDYQFGLDELFDHIDAVEAYRISDPRPEFTEVRGR